MGALTSIKKLDYTSIEYRIDKSNKYAILTYSGGDTLLDCYLAAYKDIAKRYRNVAIKSWDTHAPHTIYKFNLRYGKCKAEASLFVIQDKIQQKEVVVYTITSLLSFKTVVKRRVYQNNSGKIIIE